MFLKLDLSGFAVGRINMDWWQQLQQRIWKRS